MPVDPQEANGAGVPRRRPEDVIAAADHNPELQRQLADSIVELERGDATVPFREILANTRARRAR
jgi:hypothetical protein